MHSYAATTAIGTSDERIVKFIRVYEEFLNKLRCWELRAHFTIKRNDMKRMQLGKENSAAEDAKSSSPALKSKKPPIDPFRLRPRCGFCSQNFDKASAEETAMGMPGIPTEQKTIHICPKCKNQLPRCAVCLTSLELLNPFIFSTRQQVKMDSGKSKAENFFVWCQKCRHGGHLSHIEEWFAGHSECPVSECMCRCNSEFLKYNN